MSVDQSGKLKATPFSKRISKDRTVFSTYHGRVVKTSAQSFLEPFDAQLVLAKLTGNFERGNER